MPQLDLMHFFSQFFWFSLFFIFLFFYTYLNILPLLFKNLKYRSKKLIALSFEISRGKKNILSLCFLNDNIISNTFTSQHKKLVSIFKFCYNSSLFQHKKLESTFRFCWVLVNTNSLYLNSVLKNAIKCVILSKKKKC
jgi:hypothetical protein